MTWYVIKVNGVWTEVDDEAMVELVRQGFASVLRANSFDHAVEIASRMNRKEIHAI